MTVDDFLQEWDLARQDGELGLLNPSTAEVSLLVNEILKLRKQSSIMSEILEVLEDVARLPTANAYPDGPCLDRYMMKDICIVLAKAKGE